MPASLDVSVSIFYTEPLILRNEISIPVFSGSVCYFPHRGMCDHAKYFRLTGCQKQLCRKIQE
jgi:hypothetical protein